MIEWHLTEDKMEKSNFFEENGFDSYCLQTAGGSEIELALVLNKLNSDVLALPFLKISHKSKNGIKTTEQKVLLPRYVFLYTPPDWPLENLKRNFLLVFGLVKNFSEDSRKLKGHKRLYSKWVLSSGGIIGMSRAIKVNGKVKIVDGPLIHLEGHIKEYSKKNRNCRVETTLFNRLISVWLPFQWVEEIKTPTTQDHTS